MFKDENIENPNKSGQYLCLAKWYDSNEYQYAILTYDVKNGWLITSSCEHILWCELPENPFK